MPWVSPVRSDRAFSNHVAGGSCWRCSQRSRSATDFLKRSQKILSLYFIHSCHILWFVAADAKTALTCLCSLFFLTWHLRIAHASAIKAQQTWKIKSKKFCIKASRDEAFSVVQDLTFTLARFMSVCRRFCTLEEINTTHVYIQASITERCCATLMWEWSRRCVVCDESWDFPLVEAALVGLCQ